MRQLAESGELRYVRLAMKTGSEHFRGTDREPWLLVLCSALSWLLLYVLSVLRSLVESGSSSLNFTVWVLMPAMLLANAVIFMRASTLLTPDRAPAIKTGAVTALMLSGLLIYRILIGLLRGL